MRKAVSRIIPSRSRSYSDANDTQDDSGNVTKPATFAPFKIDFNSVSDFYIILDNPHNSWLPGDEVSGQIILISNKNLANIIITLSLIGYVKINASSHSNLRPIKHSLFHHTIMIYGNEANTTRGRGSGDLSNGLFKGEHRFPFIVKLPNKRIYTSIDFGKGSITYLLKASMHDSSVASPSQSSTQTSSPEPPTSPGLLFKTKNLKILNNTNYTSEKLINLVNPIDVSTLPTPKPKRLIIKDPRFKKLSRIPSSNSTINTFNTFSTLSSNNSDERDRERENAGHSPGEQVDPISSSHNVSSQNTQGSHPGQHNILEPHDEENHSSTPATTTTAQTPPGLSYDLDSKPDTIKVSLVIPKRGYLRGELIPIKLNINHLRKVQDLNGIIVTFVRVCRLDNGPNGLYDSFRKDLVQSVVPLYVDPSTFQSEINTSVRVPADAFPTISDCPIVSFQYFVEVLINLSGKSVVLDSNQSKAPDGGRKSPIVDFANSQTHQYNSDENPAVKAIDNLNDVRLQYQFLSANDVNHSERSTFINTDKYKRMKKFLQLTSEIVVGTHRSKTDSPTALNEGITGSSGTPNDMQVSSPSRRSSSVSDGHTPGGSGVGMNPGLPSGTNLPSVPMTNGSYGFGSNFRPDYSPDTSRTPSGIQAIPEIREFPSSVPNYHDIVNDIDLLPMPEGHMSEKERMRAHEASLMPSEPALDVESRDSVSPVTEAMLDADVVNADRSPAEMGQSTDLLRSDEEPHVSSAPEHQQQEQTQQHQENTDTFNFFDVEDQNSQIDYVPTYERSNNDQLVEDNRQT